MISIDIDQPIIKDNLYRGRYFRYDRNWLDIDLYFSPKYKEVYIDILYFMHILNQMKHTLFLSSQSNIFYDRNCKIKQFHCIYIEDIKYTTFWRDSKLFRFLDKLYDITWLKFWENQKYIWYKAYNTLPYPWK